MLKVFFSIKCSFPWFAYKLGASQNGHLMWLTSLWVSRNSTKQTHNLFMLRHQIHLERNEPMITCLSLQCRFLFVAAYGCLKPSSNFSYSGTYLEDGKIPINDSIWIECSVNVTVQSTCLSVTDYLRGFGAWSVIPECPPISKYMWYDYFNGMFFRFFISCLRVFFFWLML